MENYTGTTVALLPFVRDPEHLVLPKCDLTLHMYIWLVEGACVNHDVI
jgi:hypothetical protein